MKKTLILLLCAVVASSSFAQTTKNTQAIKHTKHVSHVSKAIAKNLEESNVNISTPAVYDTDPRTQRDEELNRINYFNNIQVQQVMNDKSLGIWEKRDALDALEFKRIQQVNVVYQKYSDSVTAYTAQQIMKNIK